VGCRSINMMESCTPDKAAVFSKKTEKLHPTHKYLIMSFKIYKPTKKYSVCCIFNH
uniref:Uncharacterized protein n=1 Tax=Oryzias latipes TaxID=8090 RepID=A0A3B3I0P3_ORYLA